MTMKMSIQLITVKTIRGPNLSHVLDDCSKIKYENKLIIKDDSPVYSLKTNISRGYLIRQLKYIIT